MSEKEASRILSPQELAKEVASCRQQGKTIVTTNGCFDVLHTGHLHLLNSAKALGDILIVAINSDRSVSQLKGSMRPLVTQQERAEILANLRPVDFVTIFDEATPVELLTIIKPNIHVKGGDYNLNNLPEASVVTAHGGTIKFIDLVSGKSSTGLLDKLKSL